MNRGLRNGAANSERGFALFMAIFTVLLVTAIGAGMILLTNTDTSISANFRDEQRAFFSAKGGIEEVRDRFRGSATNSLAANLPTALPGNTNGVLYVLNANGGADTPWVTNGAAYPDTEICTEMANMGAACAGTPAVPAGSPWYTSTTASAAYAASPVMDWKWVRITAKTNRTSSGSASFSTVDGNNSDTNERVCWTGATEVPVANTYASCGAASAGYQQVYVLTALSVTPSGSRRMVQAEATATTFPTLPGAMIFDGSNPSYSAPNSAAFTVTGNDQSAPGNSYGPGASCASGRPAQYALGGYDGPSVTALTNDVNRPASYTGAGGTPSVSNVNSALGSLSTVGGLEALVTEVTNSASAGNVYNGATSGLTNPGTIANPVINVVNGDLTLGGGFNGAGIILVTGNLTISGNPSYSGLILVIGKGSVTKNGGGNGTLDGSILVANLYNSASPPVLLPPTSNPGAPTINWNGGGNATIQYDSCWSTALSNSLAYRIVGVREIIN